MSKYKVLQKSYIGDRLVDEDTIIDYELPPGGKMSENLQALDGAPTSNPKTNFPPARPGKTS